MEYFDPQLNKHSGSYFLYFFPDYNFDYYNSEYKQYKVIKVIKENSKREVINIIGYDEGGFLISELKSDTNGNRELHYFAYRQEHRIVIDSTIHYTNKIDPIMLLPIRPIQSDTIYHREIRYFDENNRLRRGYNYFSKVLNSPYIEGQAFYPDSFFYYYDNCGNCSQIVWYSNGERKIKAQNYFYLGEGTMINVDHKDGYGTEIWKYDSKKMLTEINTEYEIIKIDYNPNKQVKFYQYIFKKESYFKHDYNQPLLLKETKMYYYDNKTRLIKIRTLSEYPNSKIDKWVLLQRYDNGLLKTDISGNTFKYIYKN